MSAFFVRRDWIPLGDGRGFHVVKLGLLGQWFDLNQDDARELGRLLVEASHPRGPSATKTTCATDGSQKTDGGQK